MNSFINISVTNTECVLTKTYWESYIFPHTPDGVQIQFINEKDSLIRPDYIWNIIISSNNFILWNKLIRFIGSKSGSPYSFSYSDANDALLFITNGKSVPKTISTNNECARIIKKSTEFIDVMKFMNQNTVEWCVSAENLNIISRVLLYYYFPKHEHIFVNKGSIFRDTGLKTRAF